MAEQPENPQANPTPDYGNLGPGSDVVAEQSTQAEVPQRNPKSLLIVAGLLGFVLALPFVMREKLYAEWMQIQSIIGLTGKQQPASPAILSGQEIENLDHQNPQQQAELLLERAINHYEGATDQIATRLDDWQGKLKLDPRLNNLVTTALNSDDLHVRAATIEIDLVANDIHKTSDDAEHLLSLGQFGSQQERVWALWTAGLLGNRGVEQERITQVLATQLRDANPDVRQWAVEGISYVGTDAAIQPLLQTLHDDPSPTVRERAACALAQSGMLTQEQRQTYVPKLIEFAEDLSLDPQTQTWVYHALRDITAQNLPNDAAAWRNWYTSSGRN
jgi:hypothetical protein